MRNAAIFISLLLMVFVCAEVAGANAFISLTDGLEYKELKRGDGAQALPGATAVIHFTGWLAENGRRGREVYNSRHERGPVSFVVGTQKVMPGWNAGVIGMKAGGSRLLRIPWQQAYGEKGVEGVIPPRTPMLFIIELLEVH